MKYWEIIADNLKKRGWSLGYVSAIDSTGRTIWIAARIAAESAYQLRHEQLGKPFPDFFRAMLQA